MGAGGRSVGEGRLSAGVWEGRWPARDAGHVKVGYWSWLGGFRVGKDDPMGCTGAGAVRLGLFWSVLAGRHSHQIYGISGESLRNQLASDVFEKITELAKSSPFKDLGNVQYVVDEREKGKRTWTL